MDKPINGIRDENGFEGDYCKLSRCTWNDEYRKQLGCNNCQWSVYNCKSIIEQTANEIERMANEKK